MEQIVDDQFGQLAENIPILCWMAKADGYIFWYNRRWHEYCGSTPEQMQGWGWQSVHDPARLPDVLVRWTESINSGTPFEMTFPLRGADGVFRPFLTRVQPIRDAAGTVVRWFGINVDVSAQIEAEHQLQAAHSRLQAVVAQRDATLSQLGEGVIVTDREGRITFVNSAATQLHGVVRLDVGPEDYAGVYSLLTVSGDPHPVDTLPLTRAVRNLETVVDAHWRIRRPDGSEILAMGNAKPIYDGAGEPMGAVLTIRDDTRRRAAEAALAEALQVKDVLLHEVNHRVKNSLQLVTSLLMLQAGRSTSPEARQSLLEAHARIGVVANMHQRLYATSRHDSVDLAIYVRELAVDTVAALDVDGRIDLQLSGCDSLLLAIDKAVPLALIVSELLTNALKYAFTETRRGTIALDIAASDGELLLAVRDDGRGLPDGFDPAASPGLGMRIVTALTRQVRGRLEVSAAAGTGATFLIRVPLAD